MKALALAMFISLPAFAGNDFMCGLYHVKVNESSEIQVNDGNWQRYKTSSLAGDKYVHVFEGNSELRITQKYRVAFRIKDKSAWNSCVPLIFYGDEKK